MSPLPRHTIALTVLTLVVGLGQPLPALAGPTGQPAPSTQPAVPGPTGQPATTGGVRTVVRAAATGAAVRACLHLVPADRNPLTVVGLGEEQAGRHGACTGPNGGEVVATDVLPGRYHLLVRPYDSDRYGAQWVGPHGGTGQRERAVTVQVRTGRTVAAPQVRLDPPGTVTGRLTRASDATPVSGGYVKALPSVPHPKDGDSGVISDDDGRYTLAGLGPYHWPLFFTGPGLASQWSGGTADRLLARTVRVRPGATVTADQTLVGGTLVQGTITIAEMPYYSQVVAFHARTGDVVGVADAAGSYTLRLLPGQRVLLRCDCAYTPSRWYPNADGIGAASSLRVGPTPLTADFDLSGPAAP
ncbi:carboxypeptidase regulatory-like domain-containing protein [Micromonospora zingiberis]|uniref:Carboxypeptidase regulatory-like domain-containing protein n=1 Tax=Micromonospora zingiberis TaxID=2053011 RepID=A0A4V2LVZ1_9ACTN|nr:carboxypeptidase-like regulatory domain-containing protein [Micromonospora zingiberis]TCB94295.1 carboxypeptidase regulatory-like domain-containing protein [Micromonospora zingiberis]